MTDADILADAAMRALLVTLQVAAPVVVTVVAVALLVGADRQQPGAESALRKAIAGLAAGKPDYAILSDRMAEVTRRQLPALKNLMARLKCRAADTSDTPGTPEVLQIGLIEALAANDPNPPPEPPPDPNAWRELAAAYHVHHFKCPACKNVFTIFPIEAKIVG